MTEAAVTTASAASERRLAAALQHRFFLRVHMTAMLVLTVLAGIFTVRLLAAIGLTVLVIRYAFAVIVAYAVFVTSVKFWLWYVGICALAAERRHARSKSGSDWADAFDFSSSGGSGGGGSSSSGGSLFEGGGGRFGGGGATGSWGEPSSQPGFMTFLSSKGGGGGGSSGGGDSDLGELILIVLIIAVIVAVFASFIWAIWAAPTILSEAAFNAVLAGALSKHAHQASRGNWVGSVMKATWIPFAAILILAILLGWYAQHYCPGATRLIEAVHCAQPAS